MAAAPFLFGKLPAHGDFIVRGLGPEAERAWDGWAASRLETLRSGSGEDFEAIHDAAVPWRFITSGADLGPPWLAGALAPSVDGAGRRFILVVGAHGLSEARAATLGLAIAEAAEQLIYRAIGEGLTADAVVKATAEMLAELETLGGPAADSLGARTSQPGIWWSDPGIAPSPGAAPPAAVLGAQDAAQAIGAAP